MFIIIFQQNSFRRFTKCQWSNQPINKLRWNNQNLVYALQISRQVFIDFTMNAERYDDHVPFFPVRTDITLCALTLSSWLVFGPVFDHFKVYGYYVLFLDPLINIPIEKLSC